MPSSPATVEEFDEGERGWYSAGMQKPRSVVPRSRLRWVVIGLAFLGTAVNYIDRACLGIAEASIRAELGLTKTEMGWVLSAFFLTYAFAQLPAGWLVDRLGARLTYAGACLWWSAFTSLTGAARSVRGLVSCRLLLGVGEAGAYPSNAKATAEWFPPEERGLASSIFDSGSRVGSALAMPLVGLVVVALGWRWSFAVNGLVGVAWAAIWLAFYRRPSEHPLLSPECREAFAAGPALTRASGQRRLAWSDLFRYRAVIGMALGFFCLSFVNYFYITWFPTFLREGQRFTDLQLGTLGMVPALVATVGGWVGGLFSDWLLRRGAGLTRARKIPIVLGLLLSSVIFFAPLAGPLGAVAWLSLSYASIAFAAAGVWALPGDVAPTPDQVASLGGIQNCASNLAGVALAPLVGNLLDRTHNNYLVPLAVAGAVGILGALVYWFVMGPVAPLGLADAK